MTLLQHPLSSPTTRPPADQLPTAWILEFILRHPIPDSLADELFLSLHPHSSPIHPHLHKTLLLRQISSQLRQRSISFPTLQSLELILTLDTLRGLPPSPRLKAAYCAAAVECAAASFLISKKEFLNAVERIWMSEAAEGLVSERLLEWGRKLERWISSGEGGEGILERDVEGGMGLVREYLEEALREMGPCFLEIVAAEIADKKTGFDEGGDGYVKGLGVGGGGEGFEGGGEVVKGEDGEMNVGGKSGLRSVEVEAGIVFV